MNNQKRKYNIELHYFPKVNWALNHNNRHRLRHRLEKTRKIYLVTFKEDGIVYHDVN